MTVMFAGLKATSLGLPLDNNLGFAYVIPYKNNRENKTEAQFQLGYKAVVQLAIRSGQFKTINVTDVREGELKGRNRMTGELDFEWIDDDAVRCKLPVVGYVGYFKLLSGYSKTTYWSIDELKQHGLKYSQTYKKGYGVWTDNFDQMCRKTVIKLMLNKGDAPMSVEMQQAIKYDQSVILDENGNHRYVDNQKPSASDMAAMAEAKEAQQSQEVEYVEVDVEQANNGELFQ
jgi:recombination protein RecT